MDRLKKLFYYCCLGHPDKFTEEETIEITIHKVPSTLDLVHDTGMVVRIQPRRNKIPVVTSMGDEIMGIPMDHIFHNS